MSTADFSVFNLNPREAASFSPVVAELAVRDAVGQPRALRADAAAELREDTFTLTGRGHAAVELELPGAVQNEDSGVEQRPSDPAPPDEPETQSRQKPRSEPQPTEAETHLSEEDQRVVNELRRTDQQVRAHEQAHAAAGGINVRYAYQTGPDGRSYAVSGTTDIAVSAPPSDANGKLAQARKLRTAALAPMDPSARDLAVVARAARLEIEARSEMANAALKELYPND